MQVAADSDNHKRVLELAQPYLNFGDPKMDELIKKAKQETSFFASIKRSASDSPPGQRIVNGNNWYGATSKELFQKLTQYAVQQDSVAFSRLMTAGLRTGQTVQFKSQQEVFIVESAMLSGLVKVRRKGDTVEYWTNYEAIK